MKIIIDIGHPAHVHYFKNYISILEAQGTKFLIFARNRKLVFSLLNTYGIDFINRGYGGGNKLSKLIYLVYIIPYMFIRSKFFKADLVVSFSSPYAAILSYIHRIPNIVIDDTEHAKFEQMLYRPFATKIISPKTFKKDFGPSHIKVNATTENFYLLPQYFNPSNSIYEKIGISSPKPYCVIRFITWEATHDEGYSGWTMDEKTRLIRHLSNKYQIIISSEGNTQTVFTEYEMNFDPSLMHDILYFADLFVGESGTMATEAAFLGTPSLMYNPLAKYLGYVDYFRGKDLLFTPRNFEETMLALKEIGTKDKYFYKKQAEQIYSETIDLTEFLINLSKEIVHE